MMEALNLEYHVGRRRRGIATLVLTAAATILVASVIHAYSLRQEVAEWESRLVQAQRSAKRPLPDSSRKPGAESAQEIAAANDVLRRLALPWSALFSAIEAGQHKNVALLSIEPDTEKLDVRIVAESLTSEDMLAYVHSLQGVALLKNVTLSQHQVRRDEPQLPVRFTVTAAWTAH